MLTIKSEAATEMSKRAEAIKETVYLAVMIFATVMVAKTMSATDSIALIIPSSLAGLYLAFALMAWIKTIPE